MAVNLTYDPANDPDTIEAEDQRDAASLEIGEKLAEEQDKLLAGKYKDAEELESAYIELQKKLGEKSGPESEEDSQDAPESKDEQEEEDPFKDDETAQIIFKASDELNDDGSISEETIEALSQMDSRKLVETYQRIQSELPDEPAEPTAPLTDESVNEIQNAVGGPDAYKAMTSWAQENFTQEEIQAYDNALEGGNLDTINFALQALYYRYTDSVGSEGEMIQGKAASAVDGFRSQAEVVRAMSDPRYDSDPAYRQDVFEKLERSQVKF